MSMKIMLIIAVLGLAVSALAQVTTLPFIAATQVQSTNVSVQASGVTAAHTVTVTAEICAVGRIVNGNLVMADQPAVFITRTTNLLSTDQVQKPLLSAQPQRNRPVPKTEPTAKQGALYDPPPQNLNTNSPAYRRAHHLPPFK